MKSTALFSIFLLAAMPLAASSSQCPDPPAGMEYVHTKDTWAEASMNGAPFVKCTYLRDGNSMGRGYHFTTYECPTFSFVRRGIAGTTAIERIRDHHRDTLTEKWYVVDKNKKRWTIWESNLFIGWRSNNHKSGDGIKPVESKTVRRIANGCSHMRTTTATADGINLIVRKHWTTKLVNKPVPTF